MAAPAHLGGVSWWTYPSHEVARPQEFIDSVFAIPYTPCVQYYVVDDWGRRFGPASVEDLNSWLAEGRIDFVSNVVEEGNEEAIPISSVPGIMLVVGSAPPHPNEKRTASTDSVANQPVKVKTYMAKAILVTCCCGFLFGIVAVVYALRAESFANGGDKKNAEIAANKANAWANWGIVAPFVWGVLNLLTSRR